MSESASTDSNLWDYQTANEIDAHDLIAATTNLVIIPSDAYYKTGDNYELVSVKFEDGTGEERSFSAFKGSVSDDEWDALTELVRYYDRFSAQKRTLFVTNVTAEKSEKYLNINPSSQSEVHIGMVGQTLRKLGFTPSD